jgi:hypothetical protein
MLVRRISQIHGWSGLRLWLYLVACQREFGACAVELHRSCFDGDRPDQLAQLEKAPDSGVGALIVRLVSRGITGNNVSAWAGNSAELLRQNWHPNASQHSASNLNAWLSIGGERKLRDFPDRVE